MSDPNDHPPHDGPQATPRPLGGYADRVRHLLAIGQLRRAEETVSEWIAHDPGNPIALVMLSLVHMVARRNQAALEAVEQALVLSPDLDVALEQRARALFVLGRFRESEEAVRVAIAADPADGDIRLLYARLLRAGGFDRDALAECEAALELDPDDAETHQLRAVLLLRTRPSQWNVPRAAAERAVALDPEDADGHAVLGAVHLAAREIPRAEERFRAALELQPTHGPAQRGLAEALMAKRPYYKPFLAYSTRMRAAAPALRIGIVIGLWMVVQALDAALRPLPDWQGARGVVLYTYIGFCAYTWFAEPITRALLRREYPWFRGLP
jgi:tetratricopeptide (TPR) repeat protein